MNLRRSYVMLLAITGCCGVLIMQLAAIQFIRTGHYSARGVDLTTAAVYQRERGVVLDDGRGRFIDRAGQSIAGYPIHVLSLTLTIAKNWSERHAEERHKLLHALGMTEEEWDTLLAEEAHVTIWRREGRAVPLAEAQLQAVQRLGGKQSGIVATPYTERYMPPYPAAHLVGYISQHPERVRELYAAEFAQGGIGLDVRIGGSGLERTFEHELRSRGKLMYSVFTDALHRPLHGLSSRLLDTNNLFYPVQAVTTLDMNLQLEIEQLLDRSRVKQASVVLLDAQTADVLAMVNRPQVDPTRPVPQDRNWANQAIKQQIPGSIFKLVIAAAALETGYAHQHESFECNGEYGKYGFSCWKKGGHGKIRFHDAFAQSCNIAFAELAKRLTPQQIELVARNLGIGRTIGWEGHLGEGIGTFRQFDQEDSGQVFAADGYDEGIRIQTAIGQRDVRITPLQAANLVVTLLQDGVLTSPRIVSELTYRDGGRKRRYPIRTLEDGGVSGNTARILLQMMRETVRSGTASSLRDHAWRLAGKTGTAETGVGEDRVHQWFVGYGPVEQPEVAAAVVIYDVPAAAPHEATMLFAKIMDVVREAQAR